MLDELGDEQSEIVVDATLLEVADELFLNADVQSLELYVLSLEQVNGVKISETNLGTNVKTATFPIGLGSHLSSELTVSVERDVFDDEQSLLGHSIEGEGTSAGVLIGPDCQRQNATF